MTSSAATARQGEAQTSCRTELITPEPAEALAGLLDIDPPPAAGNCPPCGTGSICLSVAGRGTWARTGTRHTAYRRPRPGRLRMFAGGRVSMHTPLRFGEPATRTTRVIRTTEKDGKSGPLTFVRLLHLARPGGRWPSHFG